MNLAYRAGPPRPVATGRYWFQRPDVGPLVIGTIFSTWSWAIVLNDDRKGIAAPSPTPGPCPSGATVNPDGWCCLPAPVPLGSPPLYSCCPPCNFATPPCESPCYVVPAPSPTPLPA